MVHFGDFEFELQQRCLHKVEDLVVGEVPQFFVLKDGHEGHENVQVQVEDEDGGDDRVDLLPLARHQPREDPHADGEEEEERGHESSVSVNLVGRYPLFFKNSTLPRCSVTKCWSKKVAQFFLKLPKKVTTPVFVCLGR